MFENLQLPDKSVPGIYAIVCTALGRCYIGESRQVRIRLANHFRKLATGTHDVTLLQHDHNAGHRIEYAILQEGVDDKRVRLILEEDYINQAIEAGFETYNHCSPRTKKMGNGIRSHAENVGCAEHAKRKSAKTDVELLRKKGHSEKRIASILDRRERKRLRKRRELTRSRLEQAKEWVRKLEEEIAEWGGEC